MEDIFVLRERLEYGEEVLKAIVGEDVYESMTFTAQTKLLFSMFEKMPLKGEAYGDVSAEEKFIAGVTKSIRENAVVGAGGLWMHNLLYPFTPEYQNILHRETLQRFLKTSDDQTEAFGTLISLFNSWKAEYTKAEAVIIEKELRQKNKEMADKIREKVYAPYLQNNRAERKPIVLQALYPQLSQEQIADIIEEMNTLSPRARDAVNKMDIVDRELMAKKRHDMRENIKAQMSEAISEKYGIEFHYDRVLYRLNAAYNLEFEKWLEESGEMTQDEIDEVNRFETECKDFRRKLFDKVSIELVDSANMEIRQIVMEANKTYAEAEEKDIVRTEKYKLRQIKMKSERTFKTPKEEMAFDKEQSEDYDRFVKMCKASRDAKRAGRLSAANYKQRRFMKSVRIRIRTRFEDIRVAIKLQSILDYEARTAIDYVYRVPNKLLYKHKESRDLSNALRLTDNYMKKMLGDNYPAGEEIVKEYVALCKRYYFELYYRYNEAFVKWGNVPERKRDEAVALAREASFLQAENWTAESHKRSEESFKALMDRIITTIIPNIDTSGSEVVLLPTGIVFSSNTGVKAFGFSPVSDIVKNVATEEQWVCWQKAWTSFFYHNVKVFDKVVRQGLNEMLESVFDYPQVISEVEVELNALKKEYGFALPSAIIEETGTLAPAITAQDVITLKELLPVYGKYIKSIATSSAEFDLERFKKGLSSYITSSYNCTYQMLSGTSKTLGVNISSMTTAREAYGDELNKFHTLVTTCIAIRMYTTLQFTIVKEFDTMMKEQLDIPAITLYRMIGKKIDAANERRAYMSRALFVSEFGKYIRGEAEPEVKELFDKI